MKTFDLTVTRTVRASADDPTKTIFPALIASASAIESPGSAVITVPLSSTVSAGSGCEACSEAARGRTRSSLTAR